MSEISNTQKRRFAYVLSDIEEAKQIGNGLNAHEILLDYEKNDLIIVDSELNQWSLQDYIKSITNNLLPNSHIQSDSQHVLATEITNGFMSSEIYNMVLDINERVKSIAKNINNSIENNPFIVDVLDYSIVENKLIIDELLINIGGNILSVNDTIELSPRADNSRTELIYIVYNSCGYDIVYNTDCTYNDSYIELGAEKCYYDVKKHVYINNDMYIIPIIKIDRLSSEYNNDFISYEEIYDITRRKLPNKDSEIILRDHVVSNKTVTEVLLTNLKTDYSGAICYIPFNGNDTDIISGQLLNKYAMYTESPYGKMMYNASDEGDFISFKHNPIFTLEFILKIESNTCEKLIVLYDNDLQETMHIELTEDNVIVLNTGDHNIRYKCNDGYNFIQIKICDNEISLYNNDKLIGSTTSALSYDKIRVTSLCNSIGELIISNDETFVNIYDETKSLIPTFTSLMSHDISVDKQTSFNIYDKNDNFDLLVTRKNTVNLSEHDSLTLVFNHDIDDIYNPMSKIENIIGNRIILNINNFDIDETVAIFDTSNRVYKLYRVIDIIDNVIVVDDIILDDIIGLYVCRITDISPIKLTSNDIQLNNISKYGRKIDITLDKEYNNETVFDINYKRKINKNTLCDNISNIIKVRLNDEVLTKNTLDNKSFKKSDMTCIFNNTYMDSDFNNSKIVSFMNETVDVCYGIRLTDFIDVRGIDKDIIKQFIDLNIHLEVATNMGATLLINGNEYHTDNYITSINIDNIEISDDYDIKIHMIVRSDEIPTLVIKSVDIDLLYNSIESFYTKDNNNTITKFLIRNDNGIFTNIKDTLEITYNSKAENYELSESNMEQLSLYHNGLCLVENSANIVYAYDSNKLYNLDKKYIR